MTDTADPWAQDDDLWLTQESICERFKIEPIEVGNLVQFCRLPGALRFSDRRVRVRRADLREWARHFEPVKETR